MTARARAFVAFGAHLCLAAHLMGVLHVLVVRHATCPSHGEVVHDATSEGTPAPAADGTTLRGHPAEPVEEEDGHCLYLATRRRELAALFSVPTTGEPPPSAVDLADVPSSIFVVDSSALLGRAPKTSPPIAV